MKAYLEAGHITQKDHDATILSHFSPFLFFTVQDYTSHNLWNYWLAL